MYIIEIIVFVTADPNDFTVTRRNREFTFTPYNADQDFCTNISIVDDNVLESMETFNIALSSDDACITFREEVNTIEILDNDSKYVNTTGMFKIYHNNVVCMYVVDLYITL